MRRNRRFGGRPWARASVVVGWLASVTAAERGATAATAAEAAPAPAATEAVGTGEAGGAEAALPPANAAAPPAPSSPQPSRPSPSLSSSAPVSSPPSLAAPPLLPLLPLLPRRPPSVALARNFSSAELATTAVVFVSGATLMLFGQKIFGSPTPSLGPPQPGSFDRTWSDRLHLDDGSGHHFLWRVPDIAGFFVLPYLPAIVYGIDAAYTARCGEPRLFDDPNSDHRLVAYAEAIGWTLLVAGVTKIVVGRRRPYAVLDHRELAGPSSEIDVSFFSAHSAIMFAAASFVALDASRRLDAGPLADASSFQRAVLGTVLPYLVAFGTASVVAVSRIIDQQHWPSDVLVGGLVGGAIAHLAYLTHFDEHGQPRHTRATTGTSVASTRLVPTATGVALVGLLP